MSLRNDPAAPFRSARPWARSRASKPRGGNSARIVEEEVHALPEKLRLPVLLCYWQGLTNEEAAAQLGWASGTLKARLARARSRLHQRLVRRGVTLPVGALALLLAPPETNAALTGAPVAAALRVLSSGTEQVGACAAMLADLACRAAWHVKLATVMALVLGLSALGAGFWLHATAAVEPAPGDAAKPASAAPAQVKRPEPKQSRTDRYGDPLPPGACCVWAPCAPGFGAPVSRTQLLPNGKTLLRSVGSKTAAIQDQAQWVDTDTGRITDTWQLAGRSIVCGFSPDGRRVLVYDGQVFHLWDLGRRKLVRTFEKTGEPERQYVAVFSHDADFVATCRSYLADSDLSPFRVWDVHTGKPLWTLGKFDGPSDWLIGFVPGGPLMASVHLSDMRFSLRDRTTGRWCAGSPPPKMPVHLRCRLTARHVSSARWAAVLCGSGTLPAARNACRPCAGISSKRPALPYLHCVASFVTMGRRC